MSTSVCTEDKSDLWFKIIFLLAMHSRCALWCWTWVSLCSQRFRPCIRSSSCSWCCDGDLTRPDPASLVLWTFSALFPSLRECTILSKVFPILELYCQEHDFIILNYYKGIKLLCLTLLCDMSIHLYIDMLVRNAFKTFIQPILIEYLLWSKTHGQYMPGSWFNGVLVGETRHQASTCIDISDGFR